MSAYIIRYPICIKPNSFETVSAAWTEISAGLSELGVVKGWLVEDDTMPIYACFAWRDAECWRSYKEYGKDNPIIDLTDKVGKSVLIGYYNPIEPAITYHHRSQTVFKL